MDLHYEYVSNINKKVRERLSSFEKVRINSPEDSLPYILNISVLGVKPEVLLHALEEEEVYISTQTACSTGGYSNSVYAVVRDQERASHSLRISLSYLTTKDELNKFLDSFKKNLEKLMIKG